MVVVRGTSSSALGAGVFLCTRSVGQKLSQSANRTQNTFLNRSATGHRTARNQTTVAAMRVSSRSRVVTCSMTPLPTLPVKACTGSISPGKLGLKNQTGKNYWISSRCDGLAPGEPTICTNVSVLPKRGEAACRNCTKVRIGGDC